MVLLAAEGLGYHEIAGRLNTGREVVSMWYPAMSPHPSVLAISAFIGGRESPLYTITTSCLQSLSADR